MRFRWDWLEPLMRAPYVPTLGAVAPDVLSAEVFDAILDVAHSGRFLPYDKDQRWSDSKDEHVIVEEVTHTAETTVIPTLTTRGGGTVKLHHYGTDAPDLDDLAVRGTKLAQTYGAARHRTIWFSESGDGARTRLMLKTFSGHDQRAQAQITTLDACPYDDTFHAFTDEIGPEGFSFLYQRMRAGHDDGPVLVAVDGERIVGAIGPLSILTDANGTRVQPPQYFAVHPTYRGRGHGRALWRASMAWGEANGATYKVLQASSGSAAEQLYLAEGLETLGFMFAA